MLSLILTSYDRINGLKSAIDSVLAQEDPNWQLIVSDDNSHDPNIRLYLDALDDPRIKVWYTNTTDEFRRKDNRNSMVINEACQYVKGEILGYLHDDCWLKPNCVAKVLEYFNNHPEVNSFYCLQEIREIDLETGKRGELTGVRGSIAAGYDGKPITRAFGRLDAGQVFHKSAYLSPDLRWDTNPFNYKCADGIFFDKLIEICGPIYPIMEPLVVFGIHNNNLSYKDLETWDFRW